MSKIKDEELSLEEDEEIGAEDENDEVLDVFSCKYCDFQSTNIDDLDEHIISHDEAILEDNYDEEVETTERVNHDDDPLKFSISDSKENDTESFEQPTKRIKQALPAFYEEFKNKLDKRVFVCPYCGYQSMKKVDMNKHLKVHRAPVEVPVYACAECLYTTRRKCDMPKHLLTHCKDGSVLMYKCDHCPYATKRKGDLPKHMLCHKRPELEDLYQCHQCAYSTKRRGDIKKHQLSHEHDFGGMKDNYLYNCTECGYTSKRLNDLHKHVVLHCDRTVNGFLKCTKCDYATEVSNHFAKHVLSNCRVVDMGISIFPQDSEAMQDYILLEEDELHLYQMDKEKISSVELLEKDSQGSKTTGKRKKAKNDDFVTSKYSDLDSYYIKEGRKLEDTELLGEVNKGRKNKVLVLAGYEGNEKEDCQEL